MPRHGPKPVYAAENWPDYYEEDTTDGCFQQDDKTFWHPNWSNLRANFFENLVSIAVRKCAEDDQFAQRKSKPTNDELKGPVIDCLTSVVGEKKKTEAKKRAEMTVEGIKSRTARFRVWLLNNWESMLLDALKEQVLLKRAVFRDNRKGGLGQPKVTRMGTRMMGMMNSCSLPTFTMGARWTDQARWRSNLGSGHLLLQDLAASPEKSKHRSTPVLHLPHQYLRTISRGLRLPCGHANFEDRPFGLFHPIAEYTKGMIDWDAAQKMDASYIPSYEDVFSDPAGSQARQGRRSLLEILQNHHCSVYTSLQKRLVLLPEKTSYTLKILCERCGEGIAPYKSRLQRIITGLLTAVLRWRGWSSLSLRRLMLLETALTLPAKE
ncbi:hypothetical protein D1P53_004730 [Cryptococcus gattii VGV]|nr:hypothetical protein D1P53_004730 [Cryptococcus gattii VGV]